MKTLSSEWWRTPTVFYFGENAGKYHELEELITGTHIVKGSVEEYRTAVTVGLASQACYLANISDKTVTMRWVVDALSQSRENALKEKNLSRPVFSFVEYYLVARDAVACNTISSVAKQIADTKTAGKDVLWETQMFWCLVGLIEAGKMEEVEAYLQGYKPSDLRTLMVIYLGCIYTANLRVSSSDQKNIAKRIIDALTPRVAAFVPMVISEYKGMILEQRQGQIMSIPPKGVDVEASVEEVLD